jgi:hypothetical protein
MKDVKLHPWFEGVDWRRVAVKVGSFPASLLPPPPPTPPQTITNNTNTNTNTNTDDNNNKAYGTETFRPKITNELDLSYFGNFPEEAAETYRGDNAVFKGF